MTEPIDAETQRLLDRIAEIARNVRATWFVLLGVLAFAGVTLLGVEDADFFAWGRQTTLPLVGVEIPTRSFFLTAPILVAILYGYFQFQLRELWKGLAEARARMEWARFVYAVHPGLITAAGLCFRREDASAGDALDRLQRIVVVGLIWLAGPLVLVLLWWRAMPAHEEWLTLAGGACLVLALFVGWKTLAEARHLLGDGGPLRPRRLAWTAIGVVVLAVSWARTEGGIDHYADRAIAWWNGEFPKHALLFGDDTEVGSIEELDARLEWIDANLWSALIWEHDRFWDYPVWLVSLAPVDLEGVELVPRPTDWRNHEVAEDAFREDWCDRKSHSNGACVGLIAENESEFENAWHAERSATLDNLPRLLRAGADLRAARLQGAFAPRIDLTSARLEGADLTSARLEGAGLFAARLEDANLERAWLEGAALARARLEGADLRQARLAGVDLSAARLEGAVLLATRLEDADLRDARLQGANLRDAHFEGADLRQARLENADLEGARLENADLRQARLREANVRYARLDGADLREALLGRAVLRDAWLEGADLSAARLEGADLLYARLKDADLGGARLEGAALRDARLEGAFLFNARLKGADLRSARLEGADLRAAKLQGTLLQAADFSGTTLNQDQIAGGLGDGETVLPINSRTGRWLWVWSCWTEVPPAFAATLTRYPQLFNASVRAYLLCGDREPRRIYSFRSRSLP